MKKKKNHYPDCEINNGGECDCDGNYDPKNQKSWEEKWVDIIREWHKDDPYPPIRPLVKRINQELQAERKRIVEEMVSHFEFMKQNEGKFRKNIKDGYGKAMVEETMDKVIKYLKSLEEEK